MNLLSHDEAYELEFWNHELETQEMKNSWNQKQLEHELELEKLKTKHYLEIEKLKTENELEIEKLRTEIKKLKAKKEK